MDISFFLNSLPGMYVAQSFCHSLIASIIVNRSIQAWKISNPLIKQRFRLSVIVYSFLSFPVYSIVNPERNLISFRLESLFDINRWLSLELWANFPLGLLFIFVLFLTAAIFLFQELVPIIRHLFESRISPPETAVRNENPLVKRALEELPGESPDVFIIDDDESILFSSTGREPAVYLSNGLIRDLTMKQIQSALAHEIAHIERSRRPLLIILFLLRIVLFFNPVILLQFRKVVQDEEIICDDIAISVTGNPHALAETLKKFYHTSEKVNSDHVKNISQIKDRLEDYSHNILIENRIKRLERGTPPDKSGGLWVEFILTFTLIIVINYFIV